MHGYDGKELNVLGSFESKVSFKDIYKKIELSVVKDGGPPLIGIDAMKEFGINGVYKLENAQDVNEAN